MSVGYCAVDSFTASSLHAHRCRILNDLRPACRRPYNAKRALECHECSLTPAWRRCCKQKTALRARKAADDSDDVKVYFAISKPAVLLSTHAVLAVLSSTLQSHPSRLQVSGLL